ncbi:MAG: radical SAM/SPASM domain-containing protein [Candidatus Electrothrix sp. AU1_5]|nr:radical SAM/SPASM domain-containing protein [Candidatus Electrothrix gigas]
MPYPMDIEMEITHRCNLSCRFCFQREESIKANNQPRKVPYGELDVSIIEKVLRETSEVKSDLYMHGGEPLMHQEWNDVAKVFEKYPRRLRLSTNGLLLEKRMESILRISKNLVIVFSLHGFKGSFDTYSRKGMYDQSNRNLKLILSLKKKGVYRGLVTINCVLNEQVIPNLFNFTKYCERIGVDQLIISYPWYISDHTRRKMDMYYESHFSWLNSKSKLENNKPSWYNYSFHLDPSVTNTLCNQIDKIESTKRKLPIRFHPDLKKNEIYGHISGKNRVTRRKQYCMNITKQMFILPNGNVSACKVFNEFYAGNIYKQSLIDIWKGERMNNIRKIMNNSFNDGSWPVGVCSKCNLLSGNQL